MITFIKAEYNSEKVKLAVDAIESTRIVKIKGGKNIFIVVAKSGREYAVNKAVYDTLQFTKLGE